MKMTSCFVHIDIEANGKSPVMSDMLALGAVATKPDGSEFSSFYVKIQPREGSRADPDTLQWLKDQKIYDEVTKDAVPSQEAMSQFEGWLKSLITGTEFTRFKTIMRPSAFDWQWINGYWDQYTFGGSVERQKFIGFKATCSSSLWEMYERTSKKSRSELDEIWNRFLGPQVFTHHAMEDARAQAKFYHFLLDATA